MAVLYKIIVLVYAQPEFFFLCGLVLFESTISKSHAGEGKRTISTTVVSRITRSLMKAPPFIQYTGLPDGACDIIICDHVAEHADDYGARETLCLQNNLLYELSAER